MKYEIRKIAGTIKKAALGFFVGARSSMELLRDDISSGRVMNKKGMEMVQVAILIALAVALGIIFRTEITKFINNTFKTLNG